MTLVTAYHIGARCIATGTTGTAGISAGTAFNPAPQLFKNHFTLYGGYSLFGLGLLYKIGLIILNK